MITIAKAGVSLTNLITPWILVQSDGSITQCLMFGVMLKVMAFLGCLAYAKIDLMNDQRVRKSTSFSNNITLSNEFTTNQNEN